MLRQLPARLEISFWSLMTRWMSESRLVQNIMIEAFQVKSYIKANQRKVTRLAIIWAGAGWLAGFIIGVLSF